MAPSRIQAQGFPDPPCNLVTFLTILTPLSPDLTVPNAFFGLKPEGRAGEVRGQASEVRRQRSGVRGLYVSHFIPEFALGISQNVGGRVKRVKKVKCYNVDLGEP